KPIALGMAVREMVTPGRLDRAFDRFRPGIAEKSPVREAHLAETAREPLLILDAVQVRHVPDGLRLLGQRRDETRMGVSKRRYRHAGGEVEIAVAVIGVEIGAFTPREGKLAARIGGKERRCRHGKLVPKQNCRPLAAATNSRALG